MLRVRHERPEAATSLEVKAPVWLVVTEDSYLHASGFSLEGIRLIETSDILPSSADMVLPFQGFDVTVPVRFGEGRGNFLPFAKMDARTMAILRVFHEGLASGRMVSANDVITSLDTPVDLIPMEETPEEAKKGKNKTSARWIRAIRSVVFYLLLGAAVFMTIGERVWTWLNSVPVSHALIAAPIETRPANANGFVIDIPVAVGDTVSVGDLLVSVTDTETGLRIERIRADLSALERQATQLDGEIDAMEAPMRDIRQQLEEQLQAAIDARRTTDFLSHYNMGPVLGAIAALNAFDADPWGIATQDEQRHMNLIDQYNETATDIRALTRELEQKKQQAQRDDIMANFNGVIEEIMIRPGQLVTRGMPTVSLEIEEPRFVRGYVPEERAPVLFIGMPAEFTMHTPDGEKTFPAYISSFGDVTGDLVNPELGQLVELRAIDIDVDEAREIMRPGKPVEAFADQRILDELALWWASYDIFN